jgi:C4-dicarboxylate-specific signal transduction histidine kinase
VRSDLEAESISVQTELAAPPPEVHGNRGQLQQVILNIFTNAADAMRTVDDRTKVLRVKSRALVGSNKVMISIGDGGPGIEPKNINRIFDTFFTTKTNVWAWAWRFADQSLKHMTELYQTPNVGRSALS